MGSEVVKAYYHHRLQPPVDFRRERSGPEVDLVTEGGPQLYPVEINSGRTVTSSMVDGLRRWCSQANQPVSTATLIYAGTDACTRDGIAVRPWFSVPGSSLGAAEVQSYLEACVAGDDLEDKTRGASLSLDERYGLSKNSAQIAYTGDTGGLQGRLSSP